MSTAPATPPPTPTDPAPLEYATATEVPLDITRNDDANGGGMVIRIPPPDSGLQVMRIALWSIGLAAFGTSAMLRLLDMRARGVTRLFVGHASFMPMPLAALLAMLCGYMVIRIARFGRRRMTMAIDDGGIFVDHPTRLVPRRRHVPFERFAAIETMRTWPMQPAIIMRDGFPMILHMREVDAPLVIAAVDTEIRRIRPAHPAPVERIGRIASVRIPKKRFMRDEALDARLDTYADGIRWTVAVARGWVILHIVQAGFFIWLTMAIANFIVPLEPFTFLQWTFVYALMMLALFMHETPSQRGLHPKDVVLDVVGDTLILADVDFHGRRDRWRRDQIAAIRIGGPMWWIARGGRLTVTLTDGSRVTLLYAQPLCVLKPVAQELRRALGTVTAASAASPPRAGG